MEKTFDEKVADLVLATRHLDLKQVLALRRMMMEETKDKSWATEKQLYVIFQAILQTCIERTDTDHLQIASFKHFDPLLPPGPEDVRDQERWMLYKLTQPVLEQAVKERGAGTTAVIDMLNMAEQEPIPTDSFADLFDETIVRHMRRIFIASAAQNTNPHIKLPFFNSAPFVLCMEEILREHVLGHMRRARTIRELAASRDWTSGDGHKRLLAMILGSDKDNPVLHHWNGRWLALQPAEIKSRNRAHRNASRVEEDDPWPMFAKHAAEYQYEPPTPDDIPLLQKIFRIDPEDLADHWKQIELVYGQEFLTTKKSEQARPGSVRDAIIKSIESIKYNGGDFLAIRAFFDLPKVDRMFLKALIASLGRSDTERRRIAPILWRFYENLPI